MSDKVQTDLAAALMEGLQCMSPILDAADGMKADLERRGWSPTAAESAALSWLMGAMASVWRSAT